MERVDLLIAAVGLITAVVALVTALVTLFKVEKVHVLVNSKMTAALLRIDQLKGALEVADEPVPEDPRDV